MYIQSKNMSQPDHILPDRRTKVRGIERIQDPEILSRLASGIPEFFLSENRDEDTKIVWRVLAVDQFANETLRRGNGEKIPRLLTYTDNSLFRLLRMSELTGRQFFQILGVNVPKVRCEIAQMIQVLDSLPEDQLDWALNLANQSSPSLPQEADRVLFGPTNRLCEVYYRTVLRDRASNAFGSYHRRLEELRQSGDISDKSFD